MRRTLRPAVLALGLLGALALPAAASAASEQNAPDLRCDGAYGPGVYNNVTVPPNGICTLSDATVLGNVIVQHDGNLTLQDTGSIGQNLFAGKGTTVYEDFGWVVKGLTTANAAYELTLNGTLHDVALNNTQSVDLFATTVYGNFVSNHAVYLVGIDGTTKITGNVVINGTQNGAGAIAGSYYVDSNAEIDGSVIITNNDAAGDISGNTIGQNLVCYGNTPPPVSGENVVRGRSVGQCASPTSGVGSASSPTN